MTLKQTILNLISRPKTDKPILPYILLILLTANLILSIYILKAQTTDITINIPIEDNQTRQEIKQVKTNELIKAVFLQQQTLIQAIQPR